MATIYYYRALISITIAATLGTYEPLRGQLRIAPNSGVTKEEIVDLFIHLEAYVGRPGIRQLLGRLAVFAEAFLQRLESDECAVVGTAGPMDTAGRRSPVAQHSAKSRT